MKRIFYLFLIVVAVSCGRLSYEKNNIYFYRIFNNNF